MKATPPIPFAQYTGPRPLTWRNLVQLEPRLRDLMNEAWAVGRAARHDPEFSWRVAWSRRVKPTLWKLVGWLRPDFHPVLSTPDAYDVAYQHLLQAMPSDADDERGE